MKTHGYSGTPLAKKLGIKPGFVIRLVGAPAHYLGLFSDFPEDVRRNDKTGVRKNFIHYFTKNRSDLKRDLCELREEIFDDGMIWVSWPKKASRVETDVDEGVVREIALQNGLVDIKVCAIDETWSGLKLVIPVKDRR